MVRAWHGRGMASVNQTRPHCVNQMGKMHSKPLAARHGRGAAWARHAMCESALTVSILMAVLSPTVLIAEAGLTSYFCHPGGSTLSHCTNSPCLFTVSILRKKSEHAGYKNRFFNL